MLNRPHIGIDIGGTSMRAGIVTPAGEILATARAATPSTAAELEDRLVGLVTELRRRHEIDAVGLAIAGFLDSDRRTVRFAPHLPWRDTDVAGRMEARLGVPVACEHDVNAAAVAEHRFGVASRGHNTLVFAIGTGIGAGLLLGGQLYRGSFGVAPELGHLRVVPGGRPCGCGKNGCLERYCSGTALVTTAAELARDSGFARTPLARALADDPASVTGKSVAVAAEADDPLALATFTDFATWLGLGLAMVGDLFDPDLIVVAGGVGLSASLYLDAARAHYAEEVTGSGWRRLADVVATRLGDEACLLGAAALAGDLAGVR